jgi:predicted GH43/DUF377 family glycosyl hydrolase
MSHQLLTSHLRGVAIVHQHQIRAHSLSKIDAAIPSFQPEFAQIPIVESRGNLYSQGVKKIKPVKAYVIENTPVVVKKKKEKEKEKENKEDAFKDGELCDYNSLYFIESTDLYDASYHYNASIHKYKDVYRMFYRVGNNPSFEKDRIATCLIDLSYNVLTESVLLNVISNYGNSEHVEDPRIIEYNNFWFLFYTDGYKMAVAKLDIDSCEVIYSHYLIKPANALNKNSDTREKNWIPFVENNKLYILYSDTPRTILECHDSNKTLEIVKTNVLNYSLTCMYGEIRGGCPPVHYKDNQYIWFFHTSYKSRHTNKYCIGAYITEGYTDVILITNKPILFGRPDPGENMYARAINIVFPCGAVKTPRGWAISMGIQDSYIAVLEVPQDIESWFIPFSRK